MRRVLLLLGVCLVVAVASVSGYNDEHGSDEHGSHEPVMVAAFRPHDGPAAPGTVVHHQLIGHEDEHLPVVEHHEAATEHHDAAANEHHEAPAEHHEEAAVSPLEHHVASEHDHDQHLAAKESLEHHEGIQVAKAPEGHNVRLSCLPSEGFVHVIDSSYGQGQGAVDMSTGVISRGSCHVPVDVALTGCQGASACEFMSSHMIGQTIPHFFDPCVRTHKRLVITYKCSHDVIPAEPHPIEDAHSPPIELHEFVPPVSGVLNGIQPPPTIGAFFSRFFHNQQHSSFPFPSGEECEADAHRLCGGLLKTCVGKFDCALQCVTDHAPHLSPACLDKHPCYPDIDQYCKDVHGGGNTIMRCLKANVAHLSHQCTQLHPCLLDNKCTAIDYDSHDHDSGAAASVHMPVFANIREYMEHLHAARAAPHDSEAKNNLNFMHLVLPSILRSVPTVAEHHEAVAAGHHEQLDAPYAEHHDPNLADESIPADEDAANEVDTTFDADTLGTGHFSHIVLAGTAHADAPFALDVYTHGFGHSSGLEAALWSLRSTRNQLFDLNHFGQIFWIHGGEDGSHQCLASHAEQTHQVISEPCVHGNDEGVMLSEAGRAQVWKFELSALHHIASGRCLEVQGVAHEPSNGAALHLVDCVTPSAAQSWSWESGLQAEQNPHVFDEHHERVLANRRATAEPHHLPLHEQQQVEHEASKAEVDAAVETLREQLHQEVVQRAHEHDQLVAQDHTDHVELEAARHELEVERSEARAQALRIAADEDRLTKLEHQYQLRAHEQGDVSEHDEFAHHTKDSHPGLPPPEETTHFFTPLTLILSVAFVAILGIVFRTWLCPIFVKRYAARAQPSHYYSHAY